MEYLASRLLVGVQCRFYLVVQFVAFFRGSADPCGTPEYSDDANDSAETADLMNRDTLERSREKRFSDTAAMLCLIRRSSTVLLAYAYCSSIRTIILDVVEEVNHKRLEPLQSREHEDFVDPSDLPVESCTFQFKELKQVSVLFILLRSFISLHSEILVGPISI